MIKLCEELLKSTAIGINRPDSRALDLFPRILRRNLRPFSCELHLSSRHVREYMWSLLSLFEVTSTTNPHETDRRKRSDLLSVALHAVEDQSQDFSSILECSVHPIQLEMCCEISFSASSLGSPSAFQGACKWLQPELITAIRKAHRNSRDKETIG